MSGGETAILVDATRDAEQQLEGFGQMDALVLTHGHADAIGGLAALGRLGFDGLPTYGMPATMHAARRRFRRLEHLDLVPFTPGDVARIGDWTLSCREVPHARRSDRFPTLAWRMTYRGTTLVYASDMAEPIPELRDLARGTALLVVDGATWERRIFSHLRIDEDLATICRWDVGEILLTQIGSSAPPHDDLESEVADICGRAAPAFDGLERSIEDANE